MSFTVWKEENFPVKGRETKSYTVNADTGTIPDLSLEEIEELNVLLQQILQEEGVTA